LTLGSVKEKHILSLMYYKYMFDNTWQWHEIMYWLDSTFGQTNGRRKCYCQSLWDTHDP